MLDINQSRVCKFCLTETALTKQKVSSDMLVAAGYGEQGREGEGGTTYTGLIDSAKTVYLTLIGCF